MSEAISIPE